MRSRCNGVRITQALLAAMPSAGGPDGRGFCIEGMLKVQDRADYRFFANGSVQHEVIQAARGPLHAKVFLDERYAIAIHGVHEFFSLAFALAASDNAAHLFMPRRIEEHAQRILAGFQKML